MKPFPTWTRDGRAHEIHHSHVTNRAADLGRIAYDVAREALAGRVYVTGATANAILDIARIAAAHT